jgi:outer membrane protein TolC
MRSCAPLPGWVALASAGLLALAPPAAGSAGGGEAPAIPEPLPLAWCLERAADASPALAAETHAAEAARARVRPAGALEDPRFQYEASNIPVGRWDFSSTPLSGHQLWLRQKLPFPGRLAKRADAARAAADAAERGVADRARTLASQVETAWAELGFAQRALDITDRNLDLLRRLSRTAEARYAVGSGLQQDVLRAQVELTALLKERLAREAALARAGAELAWLLDLPEARLPATAPLRDDAAPPELGGLIASIDATSPRLAALSAEIEASEQRARAAQLRGYPDLDLGLGYRVRKDVVGDPVKGDDFFSAALTFRMPVNRARWKAEVAEQRALERRAEARLRDERARLVGHLRSAHAELLRADAEARLLETGLVPQARQSLESSRSGYEVGRIDFLSLLDSHVRLLRAELQHVRALADRRAAFAALEAASGRSLR